MPLAIISQLEAFFLLEDALRILEITGPKIGVMLIIFLWIVALIVLIARQVSAERRLRIQFANQRESNQVALEKAKLDLEMSRQKNDSAETSGLHKILEKSIDLQGKHQELMAEQISSRNDLQMMIKGLLTKTENVGNWMTLASESTEAWQAHVRGKMTAAEQRDNEIQHTISPLPGRLDTILEITTAAKKAAQNAEMGITAVGVNVTDAIAKLTAIETQLGTIEASVGAVKATLIKAQGTEPAPIEVLVTATGATNDPLKLDPDPTPTAPASAPKPEDLAA